MDLHKQQNGLPILLRFLTQTARVPLAQAMSAAKPLLAHGMNSPSSIAAAMPSRKKGHDESETSLTDVLAGDEKLARQIHSAAGKESKRASKGSVAGTKRKTDPDGTFGDVYDSKKQKQAATNGLDEEAEFLLPGLDYALNESSHDSSTGLGHLGVSQEEIDDLCSVSIATNRAPVMLAFGVVALKYTKPSQPPSSRLSLAKAVMSANARSKARNIGLEQQVDNDKEEGPGKGWKGVRVLGREIPVVKRDHGAQKETVNDPGEDRGEIITDNEAALWGLDLDAEEKSKSSFSSLPIHTPQSAKAYLLKSFNTNTLLDSGFDSQASGHRSQGRRGKKQSKESLRPLAQVLRALDLLFLSWNVKTAGESEIPTLTTEQMDAKAWQWYARVRPDIESGMSGWGAKGTLKLADILALRRSKSPV